MSKKARDQATAEWAAECKARGTNWWGEPLTSSAASALIASQEESCSSQRALEPESEGPTLLVKLLSEQAVMPSRGTLGSAGFDITSIERVDIGPGKRGLVKTGLSVACPPGTYARIAPRSGLALKQGIAIGAGVVDSDYRGEVTVLIMNTGDKPFQAAPGDRIAQLIVERIANCTVTKVAELPNTSRGEGGFGSTGVKAQAHNQDEPKGSSGTSIAAVKESSEARVCAEASSRLQRKVPTALLCTERPPSIAEAKARRAMVLRAVRKDNDTSFEQQWVGNPAQPLMPLIAEGVLEGHRPHTMGNSLLGLAPEGPLCNWDLAEQFAKTQNEADEHWTALIARRVPNWEIQGSDKAKEALSKERLRLEKVPVWDLQHPVSWREVSAKARSLGTKAFIGDIMPLVYQKHAELIGDDPKKIFKGRIVYRGDAIKDEFFEWALFGEVASSPSSMAASKAADFWGALPGHAVQYSDAEMAYTQADMGGDPTYVRLPKAWWPDSWHKIADPCCRMLRALYGHPDAGYYWERHCRSIIVKLGFKELENWPNVYFHKERQLLLVVYVDDFKMAGPFKELAWGWAQLKKDIQMDDPLPALPSLGNEQTGKAEKGLRTHRYLGCDHEMQSLPVEAPLAQKLLRETAYVRVAPPEEPMSEADNQDRKPPKKAALGQLNIVKNDMSAALAQACEKYLAVAPKGTQLRKGKTPFIEESLLPDGQEPGDIQEGKLASSASSILMSLLYTARYARYDLLRPVCALASMVSRWNVHCDRMLYKLMCYVHSSKDEVFQYGFVGDSLGDCHLRLYTDADLASCKLTKKSTTGVFLVLAGPNTWFPLQAVSTKQTASSHSSTESELVAADHGLRREGIPMLDLLEWLEGHKVDFRQYGDNQSTCHIIRTGVNTTMRHFNRQHGIDLAFLHGHSKEGLMQLGYCVTDRQCGDIFTKHCVDGAKWSRLLPQIGHYCVSSAPSQWVPKKEKQIPEEAVELLKNRNAASALRKEQNWSASRSLKAPHMVREKNEGLAAPNAPKGAESALPSAQRVQANEVDAKRVDEYFKVLISRLDAAEARLAQLTSSELSGSEGPAALAPSAKRSGHQSLPGPSGQVPCAGTSAAQELHEGHDPELCGGGLEGPIALSGLRADGSRTCNAVVLRGSEPSDLTKAHYLLIEFCCSSDSQLGRQAPQNATVLRVTEETDCTKSENVNLILAKVAEAAELGVPIALWSSIPCTGGSQMQNVNIARFGVTPKLQGHWKQFHKHWAAFQQVAKAVLAAHGLVAIEWPLRCAYWQDSRVQRLLKSSVCHKSLVAGCMYGMRPQREHADDEYVGKLWRIQSTCPQFAAAIDRHCDGSHRHVPIAGDETAASAYYPELMAQEVHFALDNWSKGQWASR